MISINCVVLLIKVISRYLFKSEFFLILEWNNCNFVQFILEDILYLNNTYNSIYFMVN